MNLAVIPARYGSTRLPGKPLLSETGRPLLSYVHERVLRARTIDRVLVATDDERILAAARDFGAEAVMTDAGHTTGTDRAFEAASSLDPRPAVVVNVQGDEPETDPADLDRLVEALLADPGCAVATLAYPLPDGPDDPSTVKVVVDHRGRALYFSRAAIPHFRDGGGERLGHAGIYAFRYEALTRFVSLPRSPLEVAESLEQNRALWWGMDIRVALTAHRPFSVDTPEDYETFKRRNPTP